MADEDDEPVSSTMVDSQATSTPRSMTTRMQAIETKLGRIDTEARRATRAVPSATDIENWMRAIIDRIHDLSQRVSVLERQAAEFQPSIEGVVREVLEATCGSVQAAEDSDSSRGRRAPVSSAKSSGNQREGGGSRHLDQNTGMQRDRRTFNSAGRGLGPLGGRGDSLGGRGW